MTRMFEGLTTWNPVFGCRHHCYNDNCWAKHYFAHRWGKRFNCKLCWNFTPHFAMGNCRKCKIPHKPNIFVVAHGDLFGRWVPNDWIERVLTITRHVPKQTWFFETKNPLRYYDFLELFPENTVLSTTIETNRNYKLSKAPPPELRYEAIRSIKAFPKHISIEPIMDFDMEVLVVWMQRINPAKVSVGYDSLNNNLPEPSLEKAEQLIKRLETFTVVEKKKPWREK